MVSSRPRKLIEQSRDRSACGCALARESQGIWLRGIRWGQSWRVPTLVLPNQPGVCGIEDAGYERRHGRTRAIDQGLSARPAGGPRASLSSSSTRRDAAWTFVAPLFRCAAVDVPARNPCATVPMTRRRRVSTARPTPRLSRRAFTRHAKALDEGSIPLNRRSRRARRHATTALTAAPCTKHALRPPALEPHQSRGTEQDVRLELPVLLDE